MKFLQGRNNNNNRKKAELKVETISPQNVNQAAARQMYCTLCLAAELKQVMCLVAYVCPRDKLIRPSLQPCFMSDEFLILSPSKSKAFSQANTLIVFHIYLSDKSLKL